MAKTSSKKAEKIYQTTDTFEYELDIFPCYFHSFLNPNGNVCCYLRMNTINDNGRYSWRYCSLTQLGLTAEEALQQQVNNGIRDLYYELMNLDYAWEGSEDQFIHGAYVALSCLVGIPVYDKDGPHIMYRQHTFENWGARPKYWYHESQPRIQQLPNVSKEPTHHADQHILPKYEKGWHMTADLPGEITLTEPKNN